MRFHQINQFHEDPRIIAWWQAKLGALLTWLTPVRRRTLLAAGALWVCFRKTREMLGESELPVPRDRVGLILVLAVFLGLSWLIFRAGTRYASLPRWVRSHPQLTLHDIYWNLLVVLWNTAPEAGLWRQVFVAVGLMFPFMLWRFGYVLMAGQFGRLGDTRFTDHFLVLWPYYGGTNTPYGNGFGYLSRSEAKDNEQLARSQLAGIKLLLLAGVLKILTELLFALVYGAGNELTEKLGGHTLGIPRLAGLVAGGGTKAQLWQSWAAVYCELFFQVLRHAAKGHVIIGILRIFGFNIFRNTYKPLLAESIVEFWNRYYFYFKELMANFFFLPTFTRLGSRLRNWPKLRLMVAVFAAAFVGNTYYHLLNVELNMVTGAVFETLYSQRSRIFYCFLLALGIFVSMLREQSRGGRAPAPGLHRVKRILGVWTFFGLIFVWHGPGTIDFVTRTRFFFSLFGLA